MVETNFPNGAEAVSQPAGRPVVNIDWTDASTIPAWAAYSHEPSDAVWEELSNLAFVVACDGFEEDHPVPFLLQMHAQGGTLEDIATTLIEMARRGAAESETEHENDPEEKAWRERCRATVAAHLDRLGPGTGAFNQELADFFIELGYYWWNFDANPELDAPGALVVEQLRKLQVMGATLGDLACYIASVLRVDPLQLDGIYPEFGEIEMLSDGVYAFKLNKPDLQVGRLELRDSKGTVLAILQPHQRNGDTVIMHVVEPEGDASIAAAA